MSPQYHTRTTRPRLTTLQSPDSAPIQKATSTWKFSVYHTFVRRPQRKSLITTMTMTLRRPAVTAVTSLPKQAYCTRQLGNEVYCCWDSYFNIAIWTGRQNYYQCVRKCFWWSCLIFYLCCSAKYQIVIFSCLRDGQGPLWNWSVGPEL